MDAMEAILTRRSTRRMKAELPPRELIEQVVEAGRAAPSGHNSQWTHFIVITDPEVLARLAELVQATIDARAAAGDTAVPARSGRPFHYDAPVLIVTANRIGYFNNIADSACALENMMIAANALDLGACWVNQLRRLADEPAVRAYMESLGLREDETVTGSLILGCSERGLPKRTPQTITGNPVTWVEG